jgi:hypothetical protein
MGLLDQGDERDDELGDAERYRQNKGNHFRPFIRK